VRVDVLPSADAVVATRLAGTTVLAVDVLRASTTMISALVNGSTGITPVADATEARRRASVHGTDGVLVAGERRGAPIDGFDLGNSPLEFTRERVDGKAVFFTTSNGTRALLAAREAAAVGVAAFVNLGAAAAWAVEGGRDIVVVCAGERGARSLEDHVCAGLLVDRIIAAAPGTIPSATAAQARTDSRPYASDVARLALDSPWARRLAASGRDADVAACLRLDTTAVVPVYLAGADRVVVGSGR